MNQNIDSRDYPDLNAAWKAAVAQDLPLWIAPGLHPFSEPLVWIGPQPPAIYCEGILQWKGDARIALTIGAASEGRATNLKLDGLRVENGGDQDAVGVMLQNVCYSAISNLVVNYFGENLWIKAFNSLCGYNDFWRLHLGGGEVGLHLRFGGSLSEACANVMRFYSPNISGQADTYIKIDPAPQWAPGLWSFHDGMFEGQGGKFLDAAATAEWEFDGGYWESTPPLTMHTGGDPKLIKFRNMAGVGLKLQDGVTVLP